MELEDKKIAKVDGTDGKSCEFSTFVMFCSFVGYELAKVFMNDDI